MRVLKIHVKYWMYFDMMEVDISGATNMFAQNALTT